MAADLNKAALIPKPVSVKATDGSFELKSGAVVCIGEGHSDLLPVANYLTDRLNPATGFNVTVQVAGVIPSSNYILLEIDSSKVSWARKAMSSPSPKKISNFRQVQLKAYFAESKPFVNCCLPLSKAANSRKVPGRSEPEPYSTILLTPTGDQCSM